MDSIQDNVEDQKVQIKKEENIDTFQAAERRIETGHNEKRSHHITDLHLPVL